RQALTKGRAMKPKQLKVAVIATATLIAFAAGLGVGLGIGLSIGTSAGSAPSGRPICTANPCRVTMTRNGSDGLIIKDAPGPMLENAFLIVDPSGLAEF